MKLFGEWEAVRFPEENLIFVACDGSLYFIYNEEYQCWKKHKNAGNDHISVSNYEDISKDALLAATGGKFPQKVTDLLRLCDPSGLSNIDMRKLLSEDYPQYMNAIFDHGGIAVYDTVTWFLEESKICNKSYLALKQLFDNAVQNGLAKEEVLGQIRQLSFEMTGRDLFKDEIKIIDGHNPCEYFWIMPVRIIDYSDTDDTDCVAEMSSNEISIAEYDVRNFLYPFLKKYYEDNLEANQHRVEYYTEDDDGNEGAIYVKGFAEILSYNYYTMHAVRNILSDIYDTMSALTEKRENEYTSAVLKNYGFNAEQIVDFYHRFTYRMEYMIKNGMENGFDLISFMGP